MRLRIMELIYEDDNKSLNDIANILKLTNSAISLHIKKLEEVGLIEIHTTPGRRGSMKICKPLHDMMIIDLKPKKLNLKSYIEKEEKSLEMLMRNQVDGIIVGTHNQGILDYNNENLAVISIDTYLSDKIPIVGSDNYNGGKIATELLISKGCNKIINIDGEFNLRTQARLRKIAYEDVMKANNKTPITYEIVSAFDGGNQIKVANKILDEHPDVDGVFATNDLFAAAFINEARKRGKKIPEDIKIIGYDGTEASRSLLPDLTTIKQPIELIAKTSVDILIEKIEGNFKNKESKIALPISLLEGSTT